MLLRKAVSKQRKESFDSSSSSSCDVLNKKLRLYSSLLSSQGSLKLAFDYLSQNNDVREKGKGKVLLATKIIAS